MSSNAYLRKIQLDCAWPLFWPFRHPSLQLTRTAGHGGRWYLHYRGNVYPVLLSAGAWLRLGGLTVVGLKSARGLPGRVYVWRQHQEPDDWRHFHVQLAAGTMGVA